MKLLSWIKRDGLLHIDTCALIVIITGLFLPWLASVLIGITAGGLKELWDIKHGVANWHDFICDLVGVALGVPIILL